MPKNIVFCADGTWDHPNSTAGPSPNDTNVYKLFKSLSTSATQVPYYDDGVGVTPLPIEHFVGGAFGAGLYQKITDAYTKIAHAYEQDDRLFIFGFSRGAYTARSLAGMIAIAGLPTANFSQAVVDTAFQAYRDKDDRAALLASLSGSNMYNAKITMVGVWDTVGALGIPAIFGANDEILYGFLDTGLHPDVHSAYHAVAIDERRVEFKPTLWTGPTAPDQIVEQVWFAGVHCDVGGSYPETGLSDITLSWMLNNAISQGVEVDPASAAKYTGIDPKNSLDKIHESWNLLWTFPVRRSVPADATIANSVDIRVAGEIGYHPPNLHYDAAGKLTGYSTETVVTVPMTMATGA